MKIEEFEDAVTRYQDAGMSGPAAIRRAISELDATEEEKARALAAFERWKLMKALEELRYAVGTTWMPAKSRRNIKSLLSKSCMA